VRLTTPVGILVPVKRLRNIASALLSDTAACDVSQLSSIELARQAGIAVELCMAVENLVLMKRVRYIGMTLRSETAGYDISSLACTELQNTEE
jgi:hypothetical protein